jgi:hypothetical protein
MSIVRRVDIDGVPFIAVAESVERTRVQPVRLGMGLVAGPVVLAAAHALPPTRRGLRAATMVAGLLVSAWGLWEWSAARRVMR